ncbi:uncharacterized protein LOC111434517 [Cucurbita moschata]|uniref:Uncharacterized protein LOC111434517 n=1 Tax=Cucurbita moschata TaxID=3662 RepID=A0A6J1EIQ8_CUCMO|nr:uncharacterized protein LOC111434517 [Cucurbita moschata]
MSVSSKGCAQGEVVEKWIKIPDVNGHCLQQVAKFAVEKFNAEHGDCLIYNSIFEGWYLELGSNNLKYRLHIKAVDFLGRLLIYEVVVFEEKPDKERIRKLISFVIISNPGHCVGPVDPPKVDKWIKIPNLQAVFVIEISKFAVHEFNIKYKDYLVFDSIYEGWYMEMGRDDLKFRLKLKAIDCLKRVNSYEAVVFVKNILGKKILILESFQLSSLVVEKWIQIPSVKEPCVQVVAEFAVDEFNRKYGNILKFNSVYEGWYWELSPNSLKYRLHIKAIDFLERCLNYEFVVFEVKYQSERVRKLVSVVILVSPGHIVGPVDVPKEEKWIQIPNLLISLVVDVAKFALDQINIKLGDSKKFDGVYKAWYMEMGLDNLKFRVHFKSKDCLGRVNSFEAIVLVKHFFSLKIMSLESYKLLCS